MPSERQIEVARRLETDLVPVATQIVRDAGYAEPEKSVTRVCRSEGVVSERAKARAELRDIAIAQGLTTETFVDSLKIGLKDANSGTQRLYAELFDLISDAGKEQTVVIVLAALRDTLTDLAPDKANAALLLFGEKLQHRK